MASISFDKPSTRSSSSAPVAGQIFDNAQHARRQHIWWRGQDARQLGAQEPLSLPHRNAALQQEGADLIDDAGALADQPLPHPVQCLQIQLLRGLGRHEPHRRALHGFSNRFGIIEVVLLSLAIGADIFGRHQPGIVTERCEFAAQVMCADAGFHTDQARRYIGEPRFHLATRPLLPQHDGAAPIVAHDVERVLADIDADHRNRGIGCLRHGVLLVFGAPCQLRLLAGQEHGRTIPLTDIRTNGLRDL